MLLVSSAGAMLLLLFPQLDVMQNMPIHTVRLLGSLLLALCLFGFGSTNLVSDPSWFDYTLERHLGLAVGAVPGDLFQPAAGRLILYFRLFLAPVG